MKEKRPPIVVVLGHVDHGKTTLLDAIRTSHVASGEAGGITQSIGAGKILTKEGTFTFIDTPGHAAFKSMRALGAKVADIVLLIVAADDGAKPQTIEAINYIKEVGVPFIVVLTKTDLPSADTQKALSSLEEQQILFEGRGGNTPYIEVSAKNAKGINELLELIALLADVNEVLSDNSLPFSASVIETNKDNRGPVVSAVIKNGSIAVGDTIYAGNLICRVRGLFNDHGLSVKSLGPSDPALILGFSDLPLVGSEISASPLPAGEPQSIQKEQLKTVKKGELAVYLKASTTGSLEALKDILPPKAILIGSGVGNITETDVFMAKAAGAVILAFEVKAGSSVKRLAETESVKIYTFDIIYELSQKAEELIAKGQEHFKGKAEILAIFPFNNKRIAGCRLTEGEMNIADKVRILRGERVLGESKIISLKRGKEEIKKALPGEECGILIAPQLDFEVGDMILSVDGKILPRTH